MKRRIATWIVTLWGVIILFACVNLGTSTSTHTRYYLLESTVESAVDSESTHGAEKISIGVGPVAIAPYLQRPQMVTRIGENELRVDDFNQWAEPLQVTVSRVMAENLTILAGSPLIRFHPWKRSDDIRVKVNVDVLRFDADDRGQVTLKAIWRIVDSKDRRILRQGHSTFTRDAAGRDATHVVQAMSVALADFCRELAEVLRFIQIDKS